MEFQHIFTINQTKSRKVGMEAYTEFDLTEIALVADSAKKAKVLCEGR